MKIRATVAGLTYECGSLKDVASMYERRAADERSKMASEKTEKRQRYHCGKLQAFEEVAEFLKAVEFVDDETGQVVKDLDML